MKKSFWPMSAIILLTACNNSSNEPTTNSEPGKKDQSSTIMEKAIGNYDGQAITEYTLSNASGMKLGIMNYGGTVTKIITPDKHQQMGDVVQGYKSFAG